jgi:hypothetical protein
MNTKQKTKAGRLEKLVKPFQLINCDEAFLGISTFKNGDLCLRISNGDGLIKTAPIIAVLIQLIEIERTTQGNWAARHDPHDFSVWRLVNNSLIRRWLCARFPLHKDQIAREIGDDA